MPRPTFPHTLSDITRAVDGPFGLVVGDIDGGAIYVLTRPRKPGQRWTLRRYADSSRTALQEERSFDDRGPAIAAMAQAVGLGGDL